MLLYFSRFNDGLLPSPILKNSERGDMTSRREVLLVVGMAIPGILFSSAAFGLADPTVQPNVLVIMVDDLG